MKGIDRVASQNLFLRVDMPKTRGFGIKIRGQSEKVSSAGRYFFTQEW